MSAFGSNSWSSLSFTFSCFIFSIPPSVLLFWAVLTPLKHSTSLSTLFVYMRVPPNNPINARAPLFWVPGYHSFPKWAVRRTALRGEPGFDFLRKRGSAWIASSFEVAAVQRSLTSQPCFLLSNWFFECEHPFIDKPMIITEPTCGTFRPEFETVS